MVQPIPKQSQTKLTGKTRHRIAKEAGWQGKKILVLQVEITYYYYTWDDYPPSEDKWHFAWRDASVEDITEGIVV